MAAYLVVDIKVTDPARYEEYRTLVSPTLAAYDGKYLARGGAVKVLEGDLNPIRQIRYDSADCKMLLIEGV